MKKPKVVYDPKMPPVGVAIDTAKAAAPALIPSAVDPVILLIHQHFGRYALEMKLTKKREKPLSRG
jgi:hypothetical protein